MRILNEKENFKREKLAEIRPENNLGLEEGNNENSEQNSNKELNDVSNDDTKIPKSVKPQPEIN
jgi:hypothetical protein